jgi:hypothetical protein
MAESQGHCRLCGGPLPARKPGPGRPRTKCDRCQHLRRPPIVPDWNSPLVQTVKAEFPDDRDPFTLLLWQLSALLSGATAAADLVPLSREFGRLSALLQARKGRSAPDELDELERRCREKALQAGS